MRTLGDRRSVGAAAVPDMTAGATAGADPGAGAASRVDAATGALAGECNDCSRGPEQCSGVRPRLGQGAATGAGATEGTAAACGAWAGIKGQVALLRRSHMRFSVMEGIARSVLKDEIDKLKS